MKNIKFLILILTVAVVAASCETYDDYDTDRTPIVGFTAKTKNINGVPVGGEKSTTIEVFASDVSSSDRTYNIIMVPIEDTEAYPPAAAENFDFDTTVVIPANERVGAVSVTGYGVSLTTSRTYFKLKVEGDANVIAAGEVIVGLKN